MLNCLNVKYKFLLLDYSLMNMLIIIFRFFMFVFVIFKEVLRVMEICVVLFVFKFENNYYLVMLLYYKKGIIVVLLIFYFVLC